MGRTLSTVWLRFGRWTPVLFPLLLSALMLTLNPALRQPIIWDRIIRNWGGDILLAIVLTPIIITGGIDLSVGSIVGVSAVLTGVLWHGLGTSISVALVGGTLAGMMCGTLNGAFILTGINPLVVTLATLGAFRGLAYGLSGRYETDQVVFPAPLGDWWESHFLLLPTPLWIVLLMFVVIYILLHHTWMGRMLYAIGDNRLAARFAAVPVRGLTFSLYVMSGFVAGIVGILTILRWRAAPSFQGEGMELTAIACVVLGGARINGGAGHLAGTMLGAFSFVMLLEGMVWIRGEWRLLATGAFLIVVAAVNERLERLRLRVEAETAR